MTTLEVLLIIGLVCYGIARCFLYHKDVGIVWPWQWRIVLKANGKYIVKSFDAVAKKDKSGYNDIDFITGCDWDCYELDTIEEAEELLKAFKNSGKVVSK